MEILVNTDIVLSAYRAEDAKALVKYLNEPDIYKNTLRIPYPYTEADADRFLSDVLKGYADQKEKHNWAIRKDDGELIGGIGLKNQDEARDKDEIGYWLAKPFWGQGIMTRVVTTFSDYCIGQRSVKQLEATVFTFNAGSVKVLQKAGFVYKGLLKNHCCKEGTFIDCWLYVKEAGD